MAERKDGIEFAKLKFPYSIRMAYDISDNLEYVGIAPPGSATSQAVWKIMKLAYSGSNLTSVLHADGGRYTQVWDNHAALSYT